MVSNFDDYVKKTYRSYYQDGLIEIAVGLLLIVIGGLLFSWKNLADSPYPAIFLAVGLPALTVAGALLIRWIIHKAKERVTYDRSGYVTFRRGEPAGNRWFFLAPVLALFFVLIFFHESFLQTQFAVGYLMTVSLGYLGYRLGLWRFYLVGAAVFVIGLFLTSGISDEITGTGLTIFGIGFLLLFSGIVTFARYLLKHSDPGKGQG